MTRTPRARARGKPALALALPVPTRAQINTRTLLLLEELGTLLRAGAQCLAAGAFALSPSGTHLSSLSLAEAAQRDVYGLLVHVRDHVLPPLLLPPGAVDEAYYQAVLYLERAARTQQYTSLVSANDEGGYDAICAVAALATEHVALLCKTEPPAAPLSLLDIVALAP